MELKAGLTIRTFTGIRQDSHQGVGLFSLSLSRTKRSLIFVSLWRYFFSLYITSSLWSNMHMASNLRSHRMFPYNHQQNLNPYLQDPKLNFQKKEGDVTGGVLSLYELEGGGVFKNMWGLERNDWQRTSLAEASSIQLSSVDQCNNGIDYRAPENRKCVHCLYRKAQVQICSFLLTNLCQFRLILLISVCFDFVPY